jgi:hypothetical protein
VAQGAVAVVGDDLYPAWVDDAPDLPPGTKLYLAAPALPDVSDEDVASAVAAAVKSLHGSLLAGMTVHPVCIRAALESYRASLTGEVKP